MGGVGGGVKGFCTMFKKMHFWSGKAFGPARFFVHRGAFNRDFLVRKQIEPEEQRKGRVKLESQVPRSNKCL